MKLNYKRIKSHANDFYYAEMVSIGAKVLVFAFEASVILATILGAGYGIGKLLE